MPRRQSTASPDLLATSLWEQFIKFCWYQGRRLEVSKSPHFNSNNFLHTEQVGTSWWKAATTISTSSASTPVSLSPMLTSGCLAPLGKTCNQAMVAVTGAWLPFPSVYISICKIYTCVWLIGCCQQTYSAINASSNPLLKIPMAGSNRVLF